MSNTPRPIDIEKHFVPDLKGESVWQYRQGTMSGDYGYTIPDAAILLDVPVAVLYRAHATRAIQLYNFGYLETGKGQVPLVSMDEIDGLLEDVSIADIRGGVLKKLAAKEADYLKEEALAAESEARLDGE